MTKMMKSINRDNYFYVLLRGHCVRRFANDTIFRSNLVPTGTKGCELSKVTALGRKIISSYKSLDIWRIFTTILEF